MGDSAVIGFDESRIARILEKAFEKDPKCHKCSKPAVCIGGGWDDKDPEFRCDDHCDHAHVKQYCEFIETREDIPGAAERGDQ